MRGQGRHRGECDGPGAGACGGRAVGGHGFGLRRCGSAGWGALRVGRWPTWCRLDGELGSDAVASLVASPHPAGMSLIARPRRPRDLDDPIRARQRSRSREPRGGPAEPVRPRCAARRAGGSGRRQRRPRAGGDHAGSAVGRLRRAAQQRGSTARGVPGAAVSLVVNRWQRGGELSLRGIERAPGCLWPRWCARRPAEDRAAAPAWRRSWRAA